MAEDQRQSSRQWTDEAEDALNRTAYALRTAWDETKEARISTLEAAKEAAIRLAEAIDQGIEVARQTWSSTPEEGPAEEAPAVSDAESSSEDRPSEE